MNKTLNPNNSNQITSKVRTLGNTCKLEYIASSNLKGFVGLRDPHGKITTQLKIIKT